MKRIAGLILVLALLTSVFAGCGSDGKTPAAEQKPSDTQKAAEPQKQVKISFWGGIPAESGPQNAVDAWNKQNPDIQVEYVRYVNDESGNTKLDTALLSGMNCDLFTSHGADRSVARITAGMAHPLTDYLKKDNMDVEKMFGAGYYKYNDTVFGIPDTNPADFLWLNKTMFDKAGIPIPTDWTISEFKEIAGKLTSGTGANKVYGAFMYPGWSDNWMRPAFSVLGPDSYSEKMSFNLENEYFKKVLQMRYDMEVVDKSWVPVADVITQKLTAQDMYFKGKVAMAWAGSFLLRYVKDDKNYPHDFVSAFAPVPKWDKGQSNYYNTAGAVDAVVSINKMSQNKDAAWTFMKWWVTEGFPTYAVPFGKIPSYTAADKSKMEAALLDTDAVKKKIDLESFKRVFVGDTAATGAFFTTPLTPARNEVATMFTREVEKCLAGKQTVDQTIDSMKKQAQEITENRNK